MNFNCVPTISEVLSYYRLSQYEVSVRELGARNLNDLIYLNEVDLTNTGMTLVNARMLLSLLSDDWLESRTS